MEPFALPSSPHVERAVFTANYLTESTTMRWQTWYKPAGKTMANIYAVGAGGPGGTGVIGASGSAAGGGGGGGAGAISVDIPLSQLPNVLYIAVPFGQRTVAGSTYVSAVPNYQDFYMMIAKAPSGNAGGNASGATAGAAGTAVAAAASSDTVYSYIYSQNSRVGGVVGGIGGTTGAAPNLVLSLDGARVNGGTGGAGVPSTSVAGLSGGAYSNLPAATYFINHPGGAGGSGTTTPPTIGTTGFQIEAAPYNYLSMYGGTGGGSTHGGATGAGLVQAAGGNGGIGSGGGGMGGARTSSPAGTLASKGGNGLVIITCY